jgi:hypothetical protein
MKAAAVCGLDGVLWQMPDMVAVIFVEGASRDAKQEAATLLGGRFLSQSGSDSFVLWLYPTRECTARGAAARLRLRKLPAVGIAQTMDLAALK